MKYAMAILSLLLTATAATATLTPTLYWTSTDIGGGFMVYDFKIDCDDGLLASYAVTLAFTADPGSTINQVQPFLHPGPMNSESDWDMLDPFEPIPSGKTLDTWAYIPLGDGEIPGISPRDGAMFTGYRQGTNWFEFSLGSGAGSTLGDNVKVLHLVAGGMQAGTWAGVMARDSVLYQTSGAYPEPATMALLAAGAVALLRRRR